LTKRSGSSAVDSAFVEGSVPTPFSFRLPFGPRYRVQVSFPPPGRTKQSFKDECDVNTIMRRYEATGILPEPRGVPQYLDVSSIDFQEAQFFIAAANSRFFSLPSRIRDRFENDPAQFLAFMEDSRNAQEARELGLVPTPQPSPARSSEAIVEAPSGAPSPSPAPKGPVPANSTT